MGGGLINNRFISRKICWRLPPRQQDPRNSADWAMRRFPAPWTVEKIAGGFKVCDANGQSLAYVYSSENPNDAFMRKSLTLDEARHISSNIAKLPVLLSRPKNVGTQPPALKPPEATFLSALVETLAMSTEIKTRRTHRTWLEKVRFWQCAYETKVCDSHRELVGRGSTPETSRNAACRLWNELMEGEHPPPARHTSPSIMPPPTS